jgi:hypothetical protein
VSLTATYDEPNAVVELTVTGLLTAGAAIATIERATDPAGPWTPVRGALNMPVTGDGPDVFLDYEYTAGPGVTNYYRVVAQDPPEFVSVGTADTDSGNGVTLTPGLPAGIAAGDIMVMALVLAGASGGGIQAPSGWSLIAQSPGYQGSDDSPARSALYMKTVMDGETGPTVLMGGGIAINNAGVAQIAGFRNVRPVLLGANRAPQADQPVTTSQVEFPALAVIEDFALALAVGVTDTTWTSAAAPSPFTIIDDPTINAVEDASLAWAYDVRAAAGTVATDVFTITGGTHNPADKRGWTVALSYDSANAPVSSLFTDDVDTPLSVVWLKDPLRPARNMVVEVASPTGMRYASRSGLFDIKGRAEPIEVSEIRRSRSWTQLWPVVTFEELDGLLELFSTGRTLFLHVPARGTVPECPPWPRNLPGGYISVGDLTETYATDAALPVTLSAPVQTVAAPCADLAICEPVEDSP